MNEDEQKKFEEITDKIRARFEQLKTNNPNDGRYKCWDCDKELFDVVLDEKTKQSAPMDLNGFRSLICQECGQKEDGDY